MIDATVLGIGERAGIVDLAQLLTVLTADLGETGWNLTRLPELYRRVATYAGLQIPPTQPIVGRTPSPTAPGSTPTRPPRTRLTTRASIRPWSGGRCSSRSTT